MTAIMNHEESNIDSKFCYICQYQEYSYIHDNSRISLKVVDNKLNHKTVLKLIRELPSHENKPGQQLKRRRQHLCFWRTNTYYYLTSLFSFFLLAQGYFNNNNNNPRPLFTSVDSFHLKFKMRHMRSSLSLESPISMFASRTKTLTTQSRSLRRCSSIQPKCTMNQHNFICHNTLLKSTQLLNQQQSRVLSMQLDLAPTSTPSSSSVTTSAKRRSRKKSTTTLIESVSTPSNITTTKTATSTATAVSATSASKVVTKRKSPSSRQQSTSALIVENDVSLSINPFLNEISQIEPKNVTTDLPIADGNNASSSYANNDTINKKTGFQPLSVLDLDFRIPYPKALSPSSIAEFKKCPQSYMFQYLLGMKQPTTVALAKGSMCHAALERIFDLDPSERSLNVLQNLFRKVWSEHRSTESYKALFNVYTSSDNDEKVEDDDDNTNALVGRADDEHNVQAEIQWGREGLQLLSNYWSKE
jgi:PD-(D/E)XK nuclease superfamily